MNLEKLGATCDVSSFPYYNDLLQIVPSSYYNDLLDITSSTRQYIGDDNQPYYRVKEERRNVILHHFPNMCVRILLFVNDIRDSCKIENRSKERHWNSSRFEAFLVDIQPCILNLILKLAVYLFLRDTILLHVTFNG